jgi:starch phosphorylase
MKAAMNGVLNLSILDGWFDEAYEFSGGWAIGEREPYSEDQDEIHARSIYSILENEIIPMYYDLKEEDVPEEWLKRMKQSLRYVSPHFNCQRMITEYMEQLYEPAHRGFAAVRQNGFLPARERARWNEEVLRAWSNVGFVDLGPGPGKSVTSGSAIPLRAAVDLAGLKPGDVRVEAVLGRVGPAGQLENTQILTLPPVEQSGTVVVFGREFVPLETGRLGYSLRISPNHYDDPLTRPCNSLLKWGVDS